MFNKFIHRPVLAIVVSLVIVFLGALAVIQLPVTQYPSISPPKVNVVADYPGANGELMIKSVVIPLERALNGIPGLKYIDSDAGNDGETLISLVFELGTDANVAAVQVQNRVAAIVNKLPPIVVREGVKITREESNMLMYVNLYSDDPNLDINFLSNFADLNLLQELKRVDGVGFADILGNRDYSMRVWLKPDRMQAYKISADEVMTALGEQSQEASPGKLGESSGKKSQAFEYVLKYPGRFSNKEEYENIVIRSNANGELLRLKDVAEVEFGVTYYDIYSRLNGKPSAAIVIKQSYGSNASKVIANVKKKLEEIKASSFPKGMNYSLGYDASKFLDASIDKVLHTLLEAFLLVAFVVFIFLGDFRSTLIPILAVPVSLIGAFFFMNLFGITINLITLFALVLAIGIVVDDAIVVVEAVHAEMEANKNITPMKATELAMSKIGGAIIAITLVMASVFIPISFMSGPVGIFYRQFSVTMATSIILSGIVALTFSPAMCALLLKNVHGAEKRKTWLNKFLTGFNNWFNNLSGRYKKTVGAIVSRRIVTLLALLIFCLGSWGISSRIPSGFIPNEDQSLFYAVILTPPGSTLERTDEVAIELSKVAATIPEIKSISSMAGYEILTEGTGSNSGSCIVNLKNWDERKRSTLEVIRELEEKAKNIKGATIEFFPPPSLPGYGAAGGFEARLVDKAGTGDYKLMETVSKEFVTNLNKRKELANAFTFYSASFPQFMLRIDYDKAKQKGVNIDGALNNLSTLIGSDYETSFIKFDRPYKVMVQALPQYRALPDDLLKLYAKNDSGEMVPYAAFMKVEKVFGLAEITRHNLYNSSEITGGAAQGYSSGTALNTVLDVAKSLPKGFGIEWAGISIDESRQGNQAIYIFLISLIFVYFVLSGQYESFVIPLPIIFSLPIGIFGAFFLLKLLGLENNIYAQIAMVMLIGILGKNAVLIVEYAVQRHRAGKTIAQSAVEGAAARLRPILMTSFAFIAGLIPLVIATGPGAIGNRTIGTAAAGGMLIGTIFGVLIVPGLYYIFATIADKYKLAGEEDKPLTDRLEDI